MYFSVSYTVVKQKKKKSYITVRNLRSRRLFRIRFCFIRSRPRLTIVILRRDDVKLYYNLMEGFFFFFVLSTTHIGARTFVHVQINI